jgi:hypothetical protein
MPLAALVAIGPQIERDYPQPLALPVQAGHGQAVAAGVVVVIRPDGQ